MCGSNHFVGFLSLDTIKKKNAVKSGIFNPWMLQIWPSKLHTFTSNLCKPLVSGFI